MAVNEQLPEIAFGRRGNPDFRKAFCEQQTENQRGVALIGFLLAHLTGANPRRVTDPQLVTELCKQPFEPVKWAQWLRSPPGLALANSSRRRGLHSSGDPTFAREAPRRFLPWLWRSVDSVYENRNL